jgi:hypothetical protein
LAAIIEADVPVELTVFTDVGEGTFDVLDTGKRRSAADVLAIEGEKSSTMLAAMVRTVWFGLPRVFRTTEFAVNSCCDLTIQVFAADFVRSSVAER